MRQNCIDLAIRRLHPFLDGCVTILTNSSEFTTSGFGRNMAIGGRSSARPSTSFSNAGTCGKDLRGCAARIAVKSFSWRFRAGPARRDCPSCDQKRALLPAMRPAEEVFAPVSRRQWLLTMPKRLRIFFRYDRRLLGKLCWPAHETIRPECGREMQIISFIENCQPEVVERILRHCGLWKTAVSRPPPVKSPVAEPETSYDYGYFDRVCI